MLRIKVRDKSRDKKSQNAISHVSKHYTKTTDVCKVKKKCEPSLLLKVQEN